MFGFSILLWKIWMKYLLMWSLHFQHFVIQPSLVLQQSCLSLVTLLLFSCSVVSNSLGPHGLQHTRLSCPSPSLRACSNSCPLSWWCHLVLSHPLLLLPSIFLNIRVFFNESALHIRWPKYWSFSFSISLSNEYTVLIPLVLTGLKSKKVSPGEGISFPRE